MSDTMISVENVGKRYTLSHRDKNEKYTTLRDVIAQRAVAQFKAIGKKIRIRNGSNGSHPDVSVRPPSTNSTENFWALKGVSFEVKQGEVIGIIGRNGAGKSTLLKILSRITEPTEGRISIRGRVASLLEVGTGFHPELTGRENIYLNGAVLGMSCAEIKARFDEIVAFSEVEKFLDTPVKRYSSGMYVRLAFAVAAHLQPEILIVDEVLAVGDAEFQKKCLGKIHDVATSGRTVLFVSHNMAAVRNLCDRAMLLNQGRLALLADVNECIAAYENSTRGSHGSIWTRPPTETSGSLSYKSLSVNLEGEQPRMSLRIEFVLESQGMHKPAFVSFDITDSAGVALMQALPVLDGFVQAREGRQSFTALIDLPPLIPGQYWVSPWVGSHNTETLDMVHQCAAFEISRSPTPGRSHPHTIDHGYIVPPSRIMPPASVSFEQNPCQRMLQDTSVANRMT
ncbi:MAG TPA: polysaccharide ABC transporter ATP-binding protein [Chthoniobacterales bacterium]|nr:polysaccharide ABC transporter ATP-binding protein [Chthoniobacterales bacterium]